jgi:hypothetical protein
MDTRTKLINRPDDTGTYRIVRFFQNHPSGISRLKMPQRGLTLAQAQAHCHDPETSSSTCKSADNVARTKVYGPWFDGYEEDT